MSANSPTPQDMAAAAQQEEAALIAETRAQKNAADRVDRESEIETAEAIERKRRSQSGLVSAFANAAAYLMIHSIPKNGKIGKGPNCVVDHGTHISVPPNATEEHFRQVAQLVQLKGWNSITVFRPNGSTLHQEVSAAIKQLAPTLNICTDKNRAGSLYQCRLETIRRHNFEKASSRAAAMASFSQPQPA